MKTKYLIIGLGLFVLYCATRKKPPAGEPKLQVDDNILLGQGAIDPLEYPNLYNNAGAYNQV
jgi:hypothetical protein